MNIFVTNKCPIIAAQDHCQVHLRKMPTELCQQLCTVHHLLDNTTMPYKPTHIHHPCVKWIMAKDGNYTWAYKHFVALCNEFEKRRDYKHKCSDYIDILKTLPSNIKSGELTHFAMAMPEKFKVVGFFDQTRAYKLYLNEKFKEWLDRAKPIKVEYLSSDKPVWLEV